MLPHDTPNSTSTSSTKSYRTDLQLLPADDAPLVEWALYYAALGWHVMPLHSPIFEGSECVGCTCEAYQRSAENRKRLESQGRGHQYDPNYVCPEKTRGKHPHHSAWEDKATKDPEQIRRWWRAWPNANIGIATGPSGLLMVDEDTYKDGYRGDDLNIDGETLRALSGSGGVHLYYPMPEDKRYSNKTGDLPYGIDIRGWGGLVVVAPSMHPSGQRYQWELDYSPADREPAAMPPELVTVLDAAQDTGKRAAVSFTVGLPAPDLATWKLSGCVLELIETPAAKGQRSEADMTVCVALVYAGATDDEIRATFQNYPIGTHGKYADAGDQYLAHTIGSARGFVKKHPRERPDPDELAAFNRWLQSPNAIDDLKADGFRNPERARKLLDSIGQLIAERDRTRITPGYGALARHSGISQGGIGAYLARLFCKDRIELYPGRDGKPTGIKLVLHNLYGYQCKRSMTTVQVSKNWNIYREYRPDELFIQNHYAYSSTRIDATLPTLGDAALAVLTALQNGPLTIKKAEDETGHSYWVSSRAFRRLVEHDVVDVEVGHRNRKTYTLREDWRQILEDNRPKTPTYGVMVQRLKRYLEDRIKWQKNKGDYERVEKLVEELDRLTELWATIEKRAKIVPYVPPAKKNKTAKERQEHLVRVGERRERQLDRSLQDVEQWRLVRQLWQLTSDSVAHGRMLYYADVADMQQAQAVT